MMKQTHQ